MSTVIIIGGGGGGGQNQNRQAVETPEGAEIKDGDGLTTATFCGPNAYENAIKYLKVMKG